MMRQLLSPTASSGRPLAFCCRWIDGLKEGDWTGAGCHSVARPRSWLLQGLRAWMRSWLLAIRCSYGGHPFGCGATGWMQNPPQKYWWALPADWWNILREHSLQPRQCSKWQVLDEFDSRSKWVSPRRMKFIVESMPLSCRRRC